MRVRANWASELAKYVQRVYAIDVSDEISGKTKLPHNCNLILSDGTSIPVDPGSVDIAYSNQLMEHLHPDDAVEQLYHIHEALKPGGMYICITPNRLCGPHDISRSFDDTPRGFHLREVRQPGSLGVISPGRLPKFAGHTIL